MSNPTFSFLGESLFCLNPFGRINFDRLCMSRNLSLSSRSYNLLGYVFKIFHNSHLDYSDICCSVLYFTFNLINLDLSLSFDYGWVSQFLKYFQRTNSVSLIICIVLLVSISLVFFLIFIISSVYWFWDCIVFIFLRTWGEPLGYLLRSLWFFLL
jgi:hypothetical protein